MRPRVARRAEVAYLVHCALRRRGTVRLAPFRRVEYPHAAVPVIRRIFRRSVEVGGRSYGHVRGEGRRRSGVEGGFRRNEEPSLHERLEVDHVGTARGKASVVVKPGGPRRRSPELDVTARFGEALYPMRLVSLAVLVPSRSAVLAVGAVEGVVERASAEVPVLRPVAPRHHAGVDRNGVEISPFRQVVARKEGQAGGGGVRFDFDATPRSFSPGGRICRGACVGDGGGGAARRSRARRPVPSSPPPLALHFV
mmetsp:Transcript_6653/g.14523  ORF Transcript_6653/g.14523 Transcript_6653/m.14523 type:complete len:253 (+) Transcript_6653:1792-2550(+)